MARSLSDKYRRRVANVRSQTARLRGDVAHVLVDELRNATNEQLYQRTPLPVTHAMLNSIRPAMLGNNAAGVGYDPSRAPHARYRVNMHGTSKTGGHLLDMRLAEYLRKNADPRIRRLTRMAHRRILEAK